MTAFKKLVQERLLRFEIEHVLTMTQTSAAFTSGSQPSVKDARRPESSRTFRAGSTSAARRSVSARAARAVRRVDELVGPTQKDIAENERGAGD